MKWSWSLGKLFGIKVRVHWTFMLLLMWIAYAAWATGEGTAEVVRAIIFILAVFGCVLLHEAGHALMARRYGVPTLDITLLPIGGLARMQRIPTHPWQEFWIAVAGPAVNVVIAGVLFAGLVLTGGPAAVFSLDAFENSLLARLMWVNIILVAFNLLPAFPMDGGRMLRALLATRMDYSRATNIAAGIGQAMAILFGFAGFVLNPFLLFIALFVYLGAEAEMQAAHVRYTLGGATVRHAMMTRFHTLEGTETLRSAIDELLAGSQEDFPVVNDLGAPWAMLRRRDLVQALKDHDPEVMLKQLDLPSPPAAHEDDSLHKTLELMKQLNCNSLPVLSGDRLIGLVTLENITEWMMIRGARGEAPLHEQEAESVQAA